MEQEMPKWFNMLQSWWKQGHRGLTFPYLLGSCTNDMNRESGIALIQSMVNKPDPHGVVVFDICSQHLQEFVFVPQKGPMRLTQGYVPFPSKAPGLVAAPSWSADFSRNNGLTPQDVTLSAFVHDIVDELYRVNIEKQLFSRHGKKGWGAFTEKELAFNLDVPGYLL